MPPDPAADTVRAATVRAVRTEREDLAELGRYAFSRLCERLAGLTDDEYAWEPAPGVATIAWRLGHIADLLAEERNAAWLNSTRRAFELHVLDELIHHGAEVALVRDLHAARSVR
jgi:hypothetical protein